MKPIDVLSIGLLSILGDGLAFQAKDIIVSYASGDDVCSALAWTSVVRKMGIAAAVCWPCEIRACGSVGTCKMAPRHDPQTRSPTFPTETRPAAYFAHENSLQY